MLYGLIFFSTLFVILFLYFKKVKNKSLVQNNAEKLFCNFPAKQESYGKMNKELSEDERVELSWQFLYRITYYVLKKFSKQDIDLVHNIGRKFVALGMVYQPQGDCMKFKSC
jgi:hypothetical protein